MDGELAACTEGIVMSEWDARPRTPASQEEDPIAHDLDALRAVTARDLPSLETCARRIAARADSREGIFMTTVEKLARRPLRATAAIAAAIAVALLFIPIPYERTAGQDVSITIASDAGANLAAGGDLRPIADAFRTATGAEQIRVLAGGTTTLTARLPDRSRSEATAIARTFTRELAAKGLPATFEVTPWREKVSGNVYAQASARWREIRVDTQGRSEGEIEKDVVAQLERMGFTTSEVTFKRQAGQNELRMHAEGQSGGEKIETHVVRKGNGPEDAVAVPLPDPARLKGMTDEQIKAEIERELKAQGIENAQVIVSGGKVEVKAEKKVGH
jgi:hypothetical protein